jgi:hypothetical protein
MDAESCEFVGRDVGPDRALRRSPIDEVAKQPSEFALGDGQASSVMQERVELSSMSTPVSADFGIGRHHGIELARGIARPVCSIVAIMSGTDTAGLSIVTAAFSVA